MSKLVQIREALARNPVVRVVSERSLDNYCDYGESYWWEYVDFDVAPCTPIYDPDKLQLLLVSLIPGITACGRDNVMDGGDHITIGILIFDEPIGTQKITRHLVITDLDALPRIRGTRGRPVLTNTRPIMRQIRVKLYPAVEFAAIGCTTLDCRRIDNEGLMEHRKFMSRLN